MPNEKRLDALERQVKELRDTVFALLMIQVATFDPDKEAQCPQCKTFMRLRDFAPHYLYCFRKDSV